MTDFLLCVDSFAFSGEIRRRSLRCLQRIYDLPQRVLKEVALPGSVIRIGKRFRIDERTQKSAKKSRKRKRKKNRHRQQNEETQERDGVFSYRR